MKVVKHESKYVTYIHETSRKSQFMTESINQSNIRLLIREGLISASKVGKSIIGHFGHFCIEGFKHIKNIVSCYCCEMILSIFKMNIIRTYAYFQLEVLC